MSSATSTSPGTDRLLNQRYRIEERIARGGMATVHRGHDERLDRVVALKIMHPHLAQDEQFRRRFAREARAAARLAHRNVVGVFDQGEDGDSIYLAMELVEGETLRTMIARKGRLTVDETLDITAQILEALSAAHDAGIVHRDIKPENVIIDDAGTVKVTDFGLARAIGASHSSTSTTLLGTVAYISPEVVTSGECDERSDLYSLGVVIHEMLTGAQPFTGEQPVHIAFQHVHVDIPAPSASADGIPRAMDSLVTWACSRDPQQRPRSARELLRSVRELRATLPPSVLATRPEPREDVEETTGEIPALTSALDDAVADLDPPDARPFTPALDAAEEDPTTEEVSAPWLHGAEDDDSEDGTDDDTMRRTVVVPAPRPRRGRHAAAGSRTRTRPLAALALLAAAGVLAAGGWVGGTWWFTEGPGADRSVPVVAGTTLEDAEAALVSADLVTSTAEEFSETVPAGHVISSVPETGSTLKRGATVELIISKGRQTFAVPDLTGMSLDDARAEVEGLGLVLTEGEPAYSETVAEGSIISQSQAADALPLGGEVEVVVSEGREPIDVPSVTGRSAEAARETLEEAGFEVTTSQAHSGSVGRGAVISQTPADGQAFRGDTVSLVVSLGPEMVKVPDVFQTSEKDARKKLESAGFEVEVVYDRGEPVLGEVFAQSHRAGTEVAKGTTITITVF